MVAVPDSEQIDMLGTLGDQNAILLGKVAQGVEHLTQFADRLEKQIEVMGKESKEEFEKISKRLSSLETERTRQRTALRIIKWAGGALVGLTGWHIQQKHIP